MALGEKAFDTLINAPLPDLVQQLARAIAEAQAALDRSSLDMAKALADPANGVDINGVKHSLLSLGFTPSFYAFTETTLDIKLAFSLKRSNELSLALHVDASLDIEALTGLPIVMAASVDASYTQKYSFEASGSSSVKTRLVSLPAPAQLTELLRAANASTVSS